ncbi:MAG TPA: phosphomannomutase/phosphoglucomutase [Bryobacteraceae bacterium]|nr:phosphomannomutase/phosphoglucomutase [Bryobacteraceae bacterium]
MLPATIFREYDIRGVADRDLEDSGIEQLGRAIGTYVRRRSGQHVAVGRDTRLSSPRLRDALVRGLTAAGCDVSDVGVVPTPVLYYAVFHLKTDGAVMITGSHNPPEYNGFKVVHNGSTIHGDEIQEIRRIIERGDFETGAGSVTAVDAETPYVDEVAAQFALPRRVKVVCDAGNGTAGPVLHRILERLNVESTEMYFEMDGRFPNHHPDPTLPETIETLVETVRSTGADLGVAFDGDADRIGAVDEKGQILWGDMLLLVYAREILTRKPGATFIGEVKCSQVMYDEIERLGGKAIMYKTGHSLIKGKMKETRAELAGEMSGHMFFADRYYGFDDALYAACRLIEIVSRSGKPLSGQLEGLPAMVATPEIRVDCADEVKFDVVRHVAERFRATHNVVDIDGVRVLFDKGWGLVRASNTQPVLVTRFEAENEQLLAEYRREVEAVLDAEKAAAELRA